MAARRDVAPTHPGEGYLLVARVGRAHGIRGEVTVQVHTDAPETRFVPGASLSTGTGHLVVRTARLHNGVQLLTFDGVTDRSAAEALRGRRLYAEVDLDAEGEDDAWFDHELIGLVVLDEQGRTRGRVTGVEHLPAQDLLVIDPGDRTQRLVPLVSELVPSVDIAAGIVVVADRPGLLSDDEPDDAAGERDVREGGLGSAGSTSMDDADR